MNIEEGNKLIAEFDGNIYQSKEDLKYHSSWDLLMPVVGKIVLTYSLFSLIIGNIGTTSYFENCDLKRCYDELPIKATWQSVIEFIQWYNKNAELTVRPAEK